MAKAGQCCPAGPAAQPARRGDRNDHRQGTVSAALRREDIGPGPVIAMNHAIEQVRRLKLPNPLYSQQKDKCMVPPQRSGDADPVPRAVGQVLPVLQAPLRRRRAAPGSASRPER